MPRLTDAAIRNARPDTSDRLLSDGGNLFLRVRPSGTRILSSAFAGRAACASTPSAAIRISP